MRISIVLSYISAFKDFAYGVAVQVCDKGFFMDIFGVFIHFLFLQQNRSFVNEKDLGIFHLKKSHFEFIIVERSLWKRKGEYR